MSFLLHNFSQNKHSLWTRPSCLHGRHVPPSPFSNVYVSRMYVDWLSRVYRPVSTLAAVRRPCQGQGGNDVNYANAVWDAKLNLFCNICIACYVGCNRFVLSTGSIWELCNQGRRESINHLHMRKCWGQFWLPKYHVPSHAISQDGDNGFLHRSICTFIDMVRRNKTLILILVFCFVDE